MSGFRNEAAEFIFVRTYARWVDSLGRRESWSETVKRYVTFLKEERGERVPPKVLRKVEERMLSFDVMPSMRALHSAGDAARVDNATMYNCSFQAVDTPIAFAEALYVLMCGTGYGFSVERRYIDQLPPVPKLSSAASGTFMIDDSRKGWADSIKLLVLNLYSGNDLAMDYSRVRPQGARLKTMGGRASGPAPLIKLHEFIRNAFAKAQGRKLTPLEVHDVMNMVAEVVVVGGVRRSSQISLSDLDDEEMRSAKAGSYPLFRAMANNSAVYRGKPDPVTFLREWAALVASGTGERGIFNLGAAKAMAPARRDGDQIAGCNPCGEIQLRNRQFCNLSEVVVRPTDDLDELLDKVETAAWLGVIQSTFTHFPYLDPRWKKNCEEERLLGVSLTGQMDAPHLMTPEALKAMKARAIKVAKAAAQKMGIPMPTAVTCVKPSGTVSQLVDSSSGIHPRYAPYYIRRYRISAIDPLFRLLKDQGAPLSPENGQRKADWEAAKRTWLAGNETEVMKICKIYDRGEWDESKVNTWVVSFPAQAPEGALTRHQVGAIEQLEWYRKVQTSWCEHNASITVYVKPDEWLEVGNWVYRNWDVANGISFLPSDGGVHEQTPYEEITKEQYTALAAAFPKLDYFQLAKYETDDNTSGSKELACSGGMCEFSP